MTRLVIFDLDGTLLDTREDIAASCNYALRMCGCPERKLEEYNMMVGRGICNLFRSALPEDKRTEEMVLEMKSHFVPHYNVHLADRTKPYPGIIRMLDSLAEKGISFAVASNKYQEGTEILVRKYFSGYRFTTILGQREGHPLKPDPAIVYDAMNSIEGLTEDHTVYCGDSDVDMKTGQNAGVRTIGVAWGFRTREELAGCNPWLLVEKPEEIVNALTSDCK